MPVFEDDAGFALQQTNMDEIIKQLMMENRGEGDERQGGLSSYDQAAQSGQVPPSSPSEQAHGGGDDQLRKWLDTLQAPGRMPPGLGGSMPPGLGVMPPQYSPDGIPVNPLGGGLSRSEQSDADAMARIIGQDRQRMMEQQQQLEMTPPAQVAPEFNRR